MQEIPPRPEQFNPPYIGSNAPNQMAYRPVSAPQLSSIGLDENIVGGISHLVMLAPCMIGLVLNIVLFFAEKQSRAVRQQALQAALLPVVLLLVVIGLSVLGLLVLVAVGREFVVFGVILIELFAIIAMLGHWAGQIILAVFAFMGKPKKLPLLGDLIESISGL